MDLFYRKYGSGPPLIIVHGLYGSSDNWVTAGKALAAHFEVFIPDQRNHGRSPHDPEWNYGVMKSDLLRFMDDRSIDRAVLMGHSMGGKTVMFFAAAWPERVNGLIAIDIAPHSSLDPLSPGNHSAGHRHILEALHEIDLNTIADREDADRKLSRKITSPRVRRFLLKNLYRNHEKKFAWKLNLEVIRKKLPEILEGLDERDFEKGRQITGFPVLFIRGETSDYIRDEDSQGIRKIFPFAEIVTIPDAGHWVHAEQGDLLVQKVRDFILGS